MHRKISQSFFLVFLMLTVAACASGPQTIDRFTTVAAPTPTPDPWVQAIAHAQKTLETAELDDHFQSYKETASEINTYLGQLEKVRPALRQIDTLKKTDIPILGNAWNLIIRALDKAYLGAGVALDQVDEGVRDLLDSHTRLQRLDELDETSAAIHQFQQSPSPQTLQEMGDSMTQADFILAGVDKDAAALLDKVNILLNGIDKVQSGLALLSGIAPQVQDYTSQIKQFIDDIAAPVQELAQTLETLRTNIAQDRDVFWQIHDIIQRVKNPPESFSPPATKTVFKTVQHRRLAKPVF